MPKLNLLKTIEEENWTKVTIIWHWKMVQNLPICYFNKIVVKDRQYRDIIEIFLFEKCLVEKCSAMFISSWWKQIPFLELSQNFF